VDEGIRIREDEGIRVDRLVHSLGFFFTKGVLLSFKWVWLTIRV
jgi:hypothetical protein